MNIFNYEQFQLVSLLLKNRKNIYYAVRYHQAQSDKEKEHILDEMKGEGITFGKKKAKAQEQVKRNNTRQMEEE